jgi:hypothetical protein
MLKTLYWMMKPPVLLEKISREHRHKGKQDREKNKLHSKQEMLKDRKIREQETQIDNVTKNKGKQSYKQIKTIMQTKWVKPMPQ